MNTSSCKIQNPERSVSVNIKQNGLSSLEILQVRNEVSVLKNKIQNIMNKPKPAPWNYAVTFTGYNSEGELDSVTDFLQADNESEAIKKAKTYAPKFWQLDKVRLVSQKKAI